ncbi:MAG: hypothetical protein ACRDXF_12965 [Acidimicrobiia bacterium]
MEVLVGMVFFGVLPFFVASFTGGLAGAIQGKGREDRSLLANAGIGFVGWLAAWAVVTIVSEEPPEELTIWIGLLALLFAIVFIQLTERRRRRRPSKDHPADPV